MGKILGSKLNKEGENNDLEVDIVHGIVLQTVKSIYPKNKTR